MRSSRTPLALLFLLLFSFNHSHFLPNLLYFHLLMSILGFHSGVLRSTTVQGQTKRLGVGTRLLGKSLGVLT